MFDNLTNDTVGFLTTITIAAITTWFISSTVLFYNYTKNNHIVECGDNLACIAGVTGASFEVSGSEIKLKEKTNHNNSN